MAPTVSVVIPCFNAGKFIGETLESVYRQIWQDIEIIVVDDGSTDDSAAVIERMARPTLRLFRQANRGQTAALNAGLAHATGAFVQYLDADDLIGPDKIALQMARLQNQPRSVASAEWGRFYDRPENIRLNPEPVWRDMAPVDWLADSRAEGLGMMFPALWLIPMETVRAVGPWAEELTLNNDAEYFTRILLASGRVLFCEGARCHYRSGISGSLSGRKSPAAWRSQFRVTSLCEQYVRAREDSERVRRGFALSWQHLAHGCYPYDRAMAEAAMERARALHPVSIRPDGGATFRAVSQILGWRLARRLQVASGRP
jgi:glycosyltransferase involved in cell wall biosynthesis